MTLPEILGGAAGTLAAAAVAYRAVSAKLEGLVGKKEAPGDDSLRDVVMRIEGKIDAHREHTAEGLSDLGRRITAVEQRVFTPPSRPALRSSSDAE